MIKEIQVRIVPEEAANEQSLKRVASRETAVAVNRIQAVRMLKRSIDARQRTIFVNLKLRLFIDEQPTEPEYQSVEYRDVSDAQSVGGVGAGQGGLFAALRLVGGGLRPIILERGKDLHERTERVHIESVSQKLPHILDTIISYVGQAEL